MQSKDTLQLVPVIARVYTEQHNELYKQSVMFCNTKQLLSLKSKQTLYNRNTAQAHFTINTVQNTP